MLYLTKEILNNPKKNYSWFTSLYVLIEEVEDNIVHKPDISIEACKSLLEAIGKNILKVIHQSYLGEDDPCNQSINGLLKVVKDKLVEQAVDSEAEEEYLKRLVGVAHYIGEVRNKRAEISHGKVFPKPNISTVSFARSIISITDGFAFYLLDIFLKLNLSYKEEIKYENQRDFNEDLDEKNILPNNISFSKALYEQDFDAYYTQLVEFIAFSKSEIQFENENENESESESESESEELEIDIEIETKKVIEEKNLYDKKYAFNWDLAEKDFNSLIIKYDLNRDRTLELIDWLVLNDEFPRENYIADIVLNPPKIFERKKIFKLIENDLIYLLDKYKILLT